jgi:hypothetical protein
MSRLNDHDDIMLNADLALALPGVLTPVTARGSLGALGRAAGVEDAFDERPIGDGAAGDDGGAHLHAREHGTIDAVP